MAEGEKNLTNNKIRNVKTLQGAFILNSNLNAYYMCTK